MLITCTCCSHRSYCIRMAKYAT